jgi:anti-sigma regulatory factor (Ser/Thr protein kinase)
MLARMVEPTAGPEATPPADEVQTAEVRVPDRPASVPATRAFLTRLLDGWGVADEVIDDASLLTSELLSNAIHHGTGVVELRVEAEGGRLRVAVHDQGDETPVVNHADPASTRGSGMWIVQSIAHDWGTEANGSEPGTSVWFELSMLRALHE